MANLVDVLVHWADTSIWMPRIWTLRYGVGGRMGTRLNVYSFKGSESKFLLFIEALLPHFSIRQRHSEQKEGGKVTPLVGIARNCDGFGLPYPGHCTLQKNFKTIF